MKDRILAVFARGRADRPSQARSSSSRTARSSAATALAQRRNLHFELCYYQAIDFAIRRGFELLEAGAQGEHKLARGFRLSPTAPTR